MSSIEELKSKIKKNETIWNEYQESIINHNKEITKYTTKITQYEEANKVCINMQSSITKQTTELKDAIEILERNGFNH